MSSSISMDQQPLPARTLVLIPAFNEARHIEGVVRGILTLGLSALVVDDGSADDTAGKAAQAGAMVLRHPCNMGLTAALQTGYAFALEHGYDLLVQVDGDGQHETADIPALLAPLQEGRTDLVIGSRFLGAGDYKMPLFRRIGRAVFRFCLHRTGLESTDPTSGFQALNRCALKLAVSASYPVEYPDADALLLFWRSGLRQTEVPVRMYPNTEGRSIHNGILNPLRYVLSMVISMVMIELRHRITPRTFTVE